MDKIEKPKPRHRSEFANQGEIKQVDPAIFDSPTGREDHMGLAETSPLAAARSKSPSGPNLGAR
jgi:hypothetical protein